ncbi:MAG: GC-type dockerin domain-anchored protein, partial [Planctomycetota bacterium]|jgi:hypothetical protein
VTIEVNALAVDAFGQLVPGAVYADDATTAVLVHPDVDGDGTVGIDDLVAVVLAWGSDDADADVTADGIVDADDLIAVIGGWGETGC